VWQSGQGYAPSHAKAMWTADMGAPLVTLEQAYQPPQEIQVIEVGGWVMDGVRGRVKARGRVKVRCRVKVDRIHSAPVTSLNSWLIFNVISCRH